MNTLLAKIDARLPFTKTERIIIVIVVLMHALPALEFLHFASRPQKMDDERVMANLVSPETTPNRANKPLPLLCRRLNLRRSPRRKPSKISLRKTQRHHHRRIRVSSKKVNHRRKISYKMQLLRLQQLVARAAHPFRQTLVN